MGPTYHRVDLHPVHLGLMGGCEGVKSKESPLQVSRFRFSLSPEGHVPCSRNFPRSHRAISAGSTPTAPNPSERLPQEMISTYFGPDSDLKYPFSGPNQVEIRRESGLGRSVRSRLQWLCSSSESFYPAVFLGVAPLHAELLASHELVPS